MIALAPAPHPTASRAPCRKRSKSSWQDRYLLLLPTIRRLAKRAFRYLSLEEREEAVEEIIASTFLAYARLVERGKEANAFAWPLARFAIAQYRCGRRVGARLDIHDVMSPYCQQQKDVALESLHRLTDSGRWEELAVEDKNATPADVAACRLDFRAWLRRLGRIKRTAAKLLAGGATTGDAAKQLKLSSSRVSQLRRELKEAWEEFQGESRTLAAA